MAKMVNISGSDVRVSISYGPGDPPHVTNVAPGEAAEFQDGYCEPVKGAGVTVLPSIIARKSMVNGVARMVAEQDVDAGRSAWLASVEAHHLAAVARCKKAGMPSPELPIELSTPGRVAPEPEPDGDQEDPFEPQVAPETAAEKRARVKAEKKAARAAGG